MFLGIRAEWFQNTSKPSPRTCQLVQGTLQCSCHPGSVTAYIPILHRANSTRTYKACKGTLRCSYTLRVLGGLSAVLLSIGLLLDVRLAFGQLVIVESINQTKPQTCVFRKNMADPCRAVWTWSAIVAPQGNHWPEWLHKGITGSNPIAIQLQDN